MSEDREVSDLARLIVPSHGWAAAKAFKAYSPGEDDKTVIADRARDLLRAFPETWRAAGPMSAALAAHLERHLDAPVQVVKGSLLVDGVPVVADHVWTMIGRYVADMAIFRIAYAADGPPALVRHVAQTFGEGRGMYFDRWRHTRRLGLGYVPETILSEDAVTALVGEAHAAIRPGMQA